MTIHLTEFFLATSFSSFCTTNYFFKSKLKNVNESNTLNENEKSLISIWSLAAYIEHVMQQLLRLPFSLY